MKNASFLLRFILLLSSTCSAVQAAVIGGGMMPDLTQAQFTHPGRWRTVDVDLLAPLQPGSAHIVRITPGGKVLLAINSQSLTTSDPGPRLLGYIWGQGNLTPIYSPVWPWIYTAPELFDPGEPDGERGRLSFTLTDLNDRGEIVGICRADGWGNRYDLIAYEEDLGVIWPGGPTSTAQAINPGIASPADRYNLYKDWWMWGSSFYKTEIDKLYIDKNGLCYGRATVELDLTGVEELENQSWADYHYDVVKWENTALAPTNLTNNAAAFNAETGSNDDFSDILSLSPNGNLLIATTHYASGQPSTSHRIILADSGMDLTLPSNPGVSPSLITDSGLAVGFGSQFPSVWAGTATPSLLTGYFAVSAESGDIPHPSESRTWLRRTSTQGDYYIPVTNSSSAADISAATRQIANGLFIGNSGYTLRVPACLAVDEDGDGIIRSQGDAANASELPAPGIYPFWSNDDDDSPGATPEKDYLNSIVDGEGDLQDFFPLFLDIKQLLAVLPPSASIRYKLKQAEGGLNFVYTSLTRATAFDYRNAATATTGYGPNQDLAAYGAPTHQITATGIDIFELDPDLATRITDDDQGVILLEMYSRTAAPLKLVVEKDNVQITEIALSLVSLDKAPDVLRVNADYDEQKLDASTGYAKADSADENLLAAAGPNAGKIIVQDLHKGFFGLNPNTLPADFYAGATVTIAKLPEIDSETGLPELGEVRFYATNNLGGSGEQFWPIPLTEQTSNGATPKNLVPLLYAATAAVPRGSAVDYWIEGVKPGPITLEFKYVKGSLTFSHKQTFLVATYQTKVEWQEEIRQQILLETQTRPSGPLDFALWGPPPFGSAPFMANRGYIQKSYDYYGWLYLQNPEVFLWGGFAKKAGAAVYGGLVDAEYGRTIPPGWIPGATTLAGDLADFFQITLMKGNWEVFDDLCWQFRAYATSGIWALRYVDTTPGASLPAIRELDMPPWENMWLGEYSGSSADVLYGNYLLGQREQRYIVQQAWDEFKTRGVTGIQYLLNVVAESPLKGGPGIGAAGFVSVVGASADITTYSDRWDWVDNVGPPQGLWQDWTGVSQAWRTGMITTPLRSRAEVFSNFYLLGYPIIW